jgi:hypothetical protein
MTPVALLSVTGQTGPINENRRWLDVHHILLLSAGGTNDLVNLALLCSAHHRLEHGEL